MASTARKKNEKKEYFDPPDVLERKVDQLVQWIKDSKHMITFTGAGISTAAGIPDFRSGMDTKLATGPGVWELKAEGLPTQSRKHKVTTVLKALPTPTHMMIVKLYEERILKCCVSQNIDGLHRRSGLPKKAIAELHGNTNLETCRKCKREYLRDFRVRTAKKVHDHNTGRKCDDPSCRGTLRDTIINFGESLPDSELTRGNCEAEVADLCLAMGSSLTVTPAADIPERVAERGKRLVIVNLQKTPLNSVASLVIHAKCEEVSQMIMDKLGLDIPQFSLKRLVVIKESHDQLRGDVLLSVEGQDQFGLYFSFLKEVVLTIDGRSHTLQEPFKLSFPWKGGGGPASSGRDEMTVQLTMHFQGHYGEPPVTRDIKMKKGKNKETKLQMSFHPLTGEWEVLTEPSTIPTVPTSIPTGTSTVPTTGSTVPTTGTSTVPTFTAAAAVVSDMKKLHLNL